jgi:hypothetical protein
MRYKVTVLKKLEALQNSINGISSLLSQPNLSRQQFDTWHDMIKEKIAEIETLVNAEQESL